MRNEQTVRRKCEIGHPTRIQQVQSSKVENAKRGQEGLEDLKPGWVTIGELCSRVAIRSEVR